MSGPRTVTVMSFRIVQKPGNESSVSAAPARIGDELTTTLQAGTTNQVPLEINERRPREEGITCVRFNAARAEPATAVREPPVVFANEDTGQRRVL